MFFFTKESGQVVNFRAIAGFLIFGFITSSAAVSQTVSTKFINYSLKSGLAQSTVYAAHVSEDGFAWIGTRNGLQRFDNREFWLFSSGGSSSPLETTSVRAIVEDSEGNLWVGTDGAGLHIINPHLLTSYTLCEMLGFPKSCSDLWNILSLEQFKSKIYIGTRQNGLLLVDLISNTLTTVLDEQNIWDIEITETGDVFAATDSGVWKVSHNEKPVHFFVEARVNALEWDPSATFLWIGTDGAGLYRFDSSSSTLLTYPSIFEHSDISSLKLQAEVLWVGSHSSGLAAVNLQSNEVKYYKNNYLDSNSLAGDEIRSLYSDLAGNLWIGTNANGFSILSPGKHRFLHVPPVRSGGKMEGSQVLSFSQISENEMLVGTQNFGVSLFDSRKQTITHLPLLDTETIISQLALSDGSILLGTENGLFQVERSGEIFRIKEIFNDTQEAERRITDNSVLSLLEISEDSVLIGTYKGINLMVRGKIAERLSLAGSEIEMNRMGELTSDRILSLHPRKKGGVWVGTFSGGIGIYYPGKGIVQTFTERNSGISSDRIQSLFEGENGTLWIGTFHGLSKYMSTLDTWYTFDEKDGLPNNVVYTLTPFEENSFFLTTNNGISLFDSITETFENYTEASGLQSREFNGGAALKDAFGNYYFGGINGFNVTNREYLSVKNSRKPLTIISWYSIEGGARNILTSSNHTLHVQYPQNLITMGYSLLDFGSSSIQNFRYRINQDSRWISTESESSLSLVSLHSGEYRVEIQGRAEGENWGEASKAFHIVIAPPFWETLWFKSGIIFMVLAVPSAIWANKKQQKRKERAVRTRIAMDLHDDLSATISSIQYFNEAAIKSVKNGGDASVYHEKVKNSAVDASEKISDFIWAVNPVYDDSNKYFDRIQTFAVDCFESKSINLKMHIGKNIELPNKIELRQNLWLSIKEIIHNTVKHSRATEVELSITQIKSGLRFCLSDNGKGFDLETVKRGNGLSNVEARIKHCKGIVHISTSVGNGTKWEINLPI